MFIRVYDRARPDNYEETSLLITVIRNRNPPRFTNPATGVLDVTVLETRGIGYIVFWVNATDDDGVNIVFLRL